MAIPSLVNSVHFPVEDCSDPSKLSKLLQAMSQGSVKVAQSQQRDTLRVAAGLASVQSDVAELASFNPVLRSVDSINFSATGNALLFTAASGSYVVTDIVLRWTTVDTITDGPTFSASTATTGSDVYPEQEAYTGQLSTTKNHHMGQFGASTTLTRGTSLYIVVSTAATGTSLIASADVLGYKIQ